MKQCIKCKKFKPLDSFLIRRDNGKHRSACKVCQSTYLKKYCSDNKNTIRETRIVTKNKFPWKHTLNNIKTRCNNKNRCSYHRYGGRGIECRISEEELEQLWYRDRAYEMKKPSIDRIDNDGHYELDNCQFIEISKNIAKRNILHKTVKSVSQYDLDDNFIRNWESTKEASRELGIHASNITKCVKHHPNYKTSGGFKWKYNGEW